MAKRSARKQKKVVQKDVPVKVDKREPILAWFKFDHETRSSKDNQGTQLRRSCGAPKPHPIEDQVPCSFRDWTHSSKVKQKVCDDERFNSNRDNSHGEWAPNSSCRLTNSSGRPKEEFGKTKIEDGKCLSYCELDTV